MAADTIRDEIWRYALVEAAIADGVVTVDDVVDDLETSRRTARDALNSVAKTPLVDKRQGRRANQYVRPSELEDRLVE